jgi:hypothetical protein
MGSEVPAPTMTTTESNHEPSHDDGAHGTQQGGSNHPGDIADEPHGPGDHGETHGHDDHAHGSEPLGPIDAQAWGAFAVGIGLGLLVAVCVALSTGAL